jgi:hypothetical protein
MTQEQRPAGAMKLNTFEMKLFIFALFTFLSSLSHAQELYVFSEPASNMPAKSMSAKLTAKYPDSRYNDFFKQRYTPELMFGVNKHLMVHTSATFSDYYTVNPAWESVKLYAKYRFFSIDEVHRHFRLAAFADGSYSRSPFLYGEINTDGDNSGIQGGLIATQLVNKLAVSGTAAFTKIFAEKGEHTVHEEHDVKAFNYSLSAGYLLFPRQYTDFNQTNLNLYLELIGMKGIDKKHTMVDLAPAVQLIFNSNLKVNLGYRFQLKGDMLRVGERSWLISVERTFLGALKRK